MPTRALKLLPLAVIAASSCLARTQDSWVLISDTSLDALYFARDLNADNDADDPGETTVFFDATNASGIPSPTGFVAALAVSPGGVVYAGDNDTDSIYRLIDKNRDADANDPGEASVFYTSGSGGLVVMQTPNGAAVGPDGALYVVSAGASVSTADAVFRLIDLNNDGDALDAGEASVYVDLSTVANSSPFSCAWLGDSLYIVDLRGSSTDVVFRAHDANNDGVVDPSELSIFYDTASGLGVATGFGIAADDTSIYLVESTTSANPQRMYRLTDSNSNGTIEAGEAEEVWNEDAAPAGSVATIFDLAIAPDGSFFLGSSGSDAADNVFFLRDADADRDFLDAGETSRFVAGNGAGVLCESVRALRAYHAPCAADFNLDGQADFFDYLDFAQVFDAESPAADFNLDGQVDFFDYLDFVQAFDAGCDGR